jgi:hypothetical protein
MPDKKTVFGKLLLFLKDLERSGIHYSLAHHRDDTVTVITAVPNERWEIDFLADGTIEVERFISSGEIYDEETLDELFDRFATQERNDTEYLLSNPANAEHLRQSIKAAQEGRFVELDLNTL